MAKIMTLKDFSALGHKVRWANTTPEQRKAATSKACKARKASAKAKRLALVVNTP